MELLYVWIEDYKNIHHQGFNFSPRYRFKFEPTKSEHLKDEAGQIKKDSNGFEKKTVTEGTLTHTIRDQKNSTLPDNFFGDTNITNLTAIIGQNGAGKSNLLEFIRIAFNQLLNSEEIDVGEESKFLFLIQPEGKEEKFYYLHPEKNFTIIKGKNFSNGTDSNYSTTVVYYSSLFDLSSNIGKAADYYEGRDGDERIFQFLLTLKSRLASTFAESIEPILNEYQSDRVFEHLDFLVRMSSNSKEYQLPFRCPRKINFEFKKSEISKFIDQKLTEIDHELEMAVKAFKKLKEDKKNEKKSLKAKLKILNTLNILKRVIVPALKSEIKDDSIEELIFDLLAKLYDEGLETINIDSISQFLEEKSSDRVEVERKINEEYRNFQNLLKELTESNEINLGEIRSIFELSIDAEILKKFHKEKKLRLLIFDLFDFSWDVRLSTGEESMLSLYSSFYSTTSLNLINKDGNWRRTIELNNTTNILILIDEGEVSFHPEWQRRYLKYLIDFFPQIYSGKQIQIILTSHSPFVASDLPNKNIIFLKKGKKGEILSDDTDAEGKCIVVDGLKEKKQTFGANIHTLFSDSFFLEGGLIGEFAKEKIDKVIHYLNNSDKRTPEEDKENQSIIDMIGEPILKRQLQVMMDSKRLQRIDYHEIEIKKLQEKVKQLETDIAKKQDKSDGTP